MHLKEDQMEFTFPLKTICPNGRKLTIDHMSDVDLTAMFRAITEAAEAGEGYGEDEYVTDSFFKYEVKNGHRFVFKHEDSNRTVAWLTLSPSVVCRSDRIVSPIFIIADAYRGNQFTYVAGRFVIDFCSCHGYDGIFCDVIAVNTRMKRSVKSLGYAKVGDLSISGKVKGQGHVGSEFYFYDLRGKKSSNYSISNDGIYTPALQTSSKL